MKRLNMNKKLVKEKIEINNIENFSKLEKLMYPVKKYVSEKKRDGMYDDYNEYKNSLKWFQDRKQSILDDNKDIVTAYCIKDNKKVIGIIFSVTGYSVTKLMDRHDMKVDDDSNTCQLICFHIDKNYRGIGKDFLNNYVFKDLKDRKIGTVFIKSSHHRAFSLYEKLGRRVGVYFGLSEHQLYRRQGNIYQVEL